MTRAGRVIHARRKYALAFTVVDDLMALERGNLGVGIAIDRVSHNKTSLEQFAAELVDVATVAGKKAEEAVLIPGSSLLFFPHSR